MVSLGATQQRAIAIDRYVISEYALPFGKIQILAIEWKISQCSG